MSLATRVVQTLRAMGEVVPLAVLLGLAFFLATTERAVAEPPQGFVLHTAPKALPEITFADGEGRRLGRLIGPAEWDTPAMIAFLRGFVAGGDGGKP